MSEKRLVIVLARAGSKGLPHKNVLPLSGRPMIAHTLRYALDAKAPDMVMLSTDGQAIANAASELSSEIHILKRRPELATDQASVDAAARDALHWMEATTGQHFDQIVILYGNVPLRPATLIDDAFEMLSRSGCDSVQSLHPTGKYHPYWMKKIETEAHREQSLLPYIENNIHRRQDLPPLYMLDGGIIAVSRDSLLIDLDGVPHAFLGKDRRAIITQADEVVDIDRPVDLYLAEAQIKYKANEKAKSLEPYQIAGRQLGLHCLTYVIAEIGVNHDGNPHLLYQLIEQAKAAGADAVKVQLFQAELLMSQDALLAEYQKASATDPLQMLKQLEIKTHYFAQARDLAHDLGMAFIVTCFSPGLAKDLQLLDPDAIKFASPDLVNFPLIDTLMPLQKPLLFSTGATRFSELLNTLDHLSDQRAVVMHCVSSYPVPAGQAELGRLDALKEILIPYHAILGYSDHSQALETGMLAVARGACVIEKHLTYNRTASGPDHSASFDPEQFRQYIALIRKAEQELGQRDPCLSLAHYQESSALEADVKKVSRQSLCSTRALQKGEVLMRDDLTVKRPGTGIPAAMLEQYLGRTLNQDIEADRILTFEHFTD